MKNIRIEPDDCGGPLICGKPQCNLSVTIQSFRGYLSPQKCRSYPHTGIFQHGTSHFCWEFHSGEIVQRLILKQISTLLCNDPINSVTSIPSLMIDCSTL